MRAEALGIPTCLLHPKPITHPPSLPLPPSNPQLMHHYELSNTALGIPSFRQLVEGYGDTVIAKAVNLHSLYLHPSPVYQLRHLLGELLRGVPAAHGEGARRVLGFFMLFFGGVGGGPVHKRCTSSGT